LVRSAFEAKTKPDFVSSTAGRPPARDVAPVPSSQLTRRWREMDSNFRFPPGSTPYSRGPIQSLILQAEGADDGQGHRDTSVPEILPARRSH